MRSTLGTTGRFIVLTLTLVAGSAVALVLRSAAATNHNPTGSFDYATPGADGVMVVGGATDPDSSSPVHVNVTSDGKLVAGLIANLAPHSGHGWVAKLNLAVGTHNVCATAVNLGAGANTNLGCKSVIVAHDPRGSLDYVQQKGAGLYIVGGATDPDAPSAKVSVQIGLDGTTAKTVTADQPVHSGHGYVLTLPVTAGSHTVCITAVNQGPGANVTLGCKTVTVNLNPSGSLDYVQQKGATAYIVGGATDPDSPSAYLKVQITIGGKTVTTFTANQPVHSGHGYVGTVAVGSGSQNVCAIAVNVGQGQNTNLGCKTVVFDMDPRGSLDYVQQRGTDFYIVGGVTDPNTTGAVSARVLVDGTAVSTLTANQPVHSGHGYVGLVAIKTVGAHTVCTVGVNVGAGADANLGCKTLTVAFNPYGGYENAVRTGSTGVTITGWAIDPTSPTTALTVQISVDGVIVARVPANVTRNDVGQAHPDAGAKHGYLTTINVNAQEHHICVVAYNVGPGANTTIGCRIVNALHPVAPGAPSSVTATTSYGGATVTWTASTSDGGAPVSSYRVTSSPASTTVSVPATATSAVVTGLKANTKYVFSVVAVNVAGASVAATAPAVTTPASPPPQTTAAPISTSRYTRNINGASTAMRNKMFNEGAADAMANPSGHRYLILLDIGGQDEGDHGVVLTAGVRFVSYTDLVLNLESYVSGYANYMKPSAPAVIALGTNNDMDTSAASGASWANNVVDPVAAFARSRQFGNIVIAGADDMEPGFRASLTATKAWLQGYLGATSAPFVFNGSADGCSWTKTNGACNNGWNHAGLYYLSGGAAPNRITNLPQIYNTTMASQWKYISLTGVGSGQPRINFGGPLTEYTACAQAGSCYSMTGAAAWNALWSALQSDAALKVNSLPFSTDLRIDS